MMPYFYNVLAKSTFFLIWRNSIFVKHIWGVVIQKCPSTSPSSFAIPCADFLHVGNRSKIMPEPIWREKRWSWGEDWSLSCSAQQGAFYCLWIIYYVQNDRKFEENGLRKTSVKVIFKLNSSVSHWIVLYLRSRCSNCWQWVTPVSAAETTIPNMVTHLFLRSECRQSKRNASKKLSSPWRGDEKSEETLEEDKVTSSNNFTLF